MKQIMIWMILAVGLSVGACHRQRRLLVTRRILRPGHSVYSQDVRSGIGCCPDENKAPWVSLALQGYGGTQQILFSVEVGDFDQGGGGCAISRKT